MWRNWQTRTTQNREGNRGGSSPFTGIYRDVAQLGRAPGLGPGGRMFKSCRPDQMKDHRITSVVFLLCEVMTTSAYASAF